MDLDKITIPAVSTATVTGAEVSAEVSADANLGVEEMKTFTFRNIPLTLHTVWKTCAVISGVSMEEFALTALQKHIIEFKGQKQ
jgi:hypothetical protein